MNTFLFINSDYSFLAFKEYKDDSPDENMQNKRYKMQIDTSPGEVVMHVVALGEIGRVFVRASL